MLKQDARRKVGGRSKPGDAESSSFELFQLGYSGADEHEEIIPRLHSRNERQVKTLQTGLHNRADVHQRRVAGSQRLSCDLAATKKDGLDIQAVLSEESLLLANPNMALRGAEGRVADPDSLQFLGGCGSGEGQETKR